MNIDETTRLCRLIRALCPAQKWDEDTPAVWTQVLARISLQDALAAAQQIAEREAFIAPRDIVGEVRRLRGRRLAGVDTITPNVDPDDRAAYRLELAAIARGVANGTLDVDAYRAGTIALTGPAPMRAIEGPGGARPDVSRAFRRAPAPTAGDYGTAPVQIRATVTAGEADAMEAERRRQLAALDAMGARP